TLPLLDGSRRRARRAARRRGVARLPAGGARAARAARRCACAERLAAPRRRKPRLVPLLALRDAARRRRRGRELGAVDPARPAVPARALDGRRLARAAEGGRRATGLRA